MILNLTQHKATAEQIAAGVVDLEGEEREALIALLTFEELPDRATICKAAVKITQFAGYHGAKDAMIGGAPFLMAPLQQELASAGIRAQYAFSTRESVEATQADGSVKKVAIFRHVGFVMAV